MMTAARMLVPGSLMAGARPIDRLFEQFLGYEAAIREDGTPTYALPLDILETEDAYELHATVAGVPEDGVEVTFEGGMLSIAAKAVPFETQGTFIRQEQPSKRGPRVTQVPQTMNTLDTYSICLHLVVTTCRRRVEAPFAFNPLNAIG